MKAEKHTVLTKFTIYVIGPIIALSINIDRYSICVKINVDIVHIHYTYIPDVVVHKTHQYCLNFAPLLGG